MENNRAMNLSHKMRKMPAMEPRPKGSPFSPQNSHSPKGQVFSVPSSVVFVRQTSQMHSFVFQVEGNSVRPRLAVFRSRAHMQLPWHLTAAQFKIGS